MIREDIFKNWEESKKRLKQQYPHLTDEDLYYEIGKEEELLERLQGKMNKTKEEIFNWLHIMG